ncbi:MAG: hypothetical protein IPL64_07355 [Flavobacteriales bacterium]|nr:hypothetical protein [Flavobacteriales bacterium]
MMRGEQGPYFADGELPDLFDILRKGEPDMEQTDLIKAQLQQAGYHDGLAVVRRWGLPHNEYTVRTGG